jgi:hypothetical protein
MTARRVARRGAEWKRLEEDGRRDANWKRWGPYLSERQWGTVREDYSEHGNCWEYFPHDHARSRAYRWGEDGLLGICDREGRLCFALALWNERDPILKERLFGLTGPQGNHGEDVKECYHYLDSTPTHSYMSALYRYPRAAYPYEDLERESARRTPEDPEYDLEDTGVFSAGWFDVRAEYAKAGPNDLLIRIAIGNRGVGAARLHVLPMLWFRNTWIWGCRHEGCTLKPRIERRDETSVATDHETLGRFLMHFDRGPEGGVPPLLLTENETNSQLLYGVESYTPYVRDAFHRYLVDGDQGAVSPGSRGTRVAPHYVLELPESADVTLRLRLHAEDEDPGEPFGAGFERVFAQRRREADAFYASALPKGLGKEERRVAREAYAGLLWTKQFYHYIVEDWLDGDPASPPPESRRRGRNNDWHHVFARDVLSMPDKWEYPWFAAWDLAFHMIPFARIDPDFAKQQLQLFLREWYMHPNGQIPAYEFAFSDVNPPVHAWACWRVYKMTAPRGARDHLFLARCFQKLMLNFTWWVNRKDVEGRHVFSGGFLGLDNIGVFDRSQPLPTGGVLEQADGTAWMAFFCTTMLEIALELAQRDPVYEDIASKFFEHFVAIADAINHLDGTGLWDEEDGFYYDYLRRDGHSSPLRVRSLVGLMPLAAVLVLEEEVLSRLPGFAKRAQWFLENRRDLGPQISYLETRPEVGRRLLAIPSRERLERVLRSLLDDEEFLSPYGIRSLSRAHLKQPFVLHVDGHEHRVDYVPGESSTYIFGGNSNWRGPVWFPINYLLIESLERYHYYFGDDLKVECPTGSGQRMNLREVARELSRRLSALFLPGAGGARPCHGQNPLYSSDPQWRDLLLFHEYFHGDTGRGLGASHQTGWTALVAQCLEKAHRS